jgi:hypothetical protein
MRPVGRRRMTLLDAVLLVGSAAIGLGLFELAHRTLFKGQIWLADNGVPNFKTWSTMEVLVLCSDIAAFSLPVVVPWTFLLIALRMRQPRPAWRRAWQQPGMAACLAAIVGWLWTVLPLLLAMNAGQVARSTRSITLEEWANKYLGDELFMYVGAAVGATWLVQYMSGRWRKPADWIDVMGRIVGVMWIVIGLIWTLHEYMEFV